MKSIQLFDPSHQINAIINLNGEMASLTDLWKAAGSPNKKDPYTWTTRESTSELIETVCSMLNTPKMGVLKTSRGKGKNGTWAHKNIALSYAKWLSPELHILVNQVFFERIEEEKNPDLIVDRAISTYQKKGKTQEWIGRRIEGKLYRNEFTKTLAAHGVEKEGFRNCTNAIYEGLYGGTSSVVREKKNIPANASIRDNIPAFELEMVKFSEALATEKIRRENIQGNAKCEMLSREASKMVGRDIFNYINKK
jgi:hypothetical protein